jgi:hypothetical protein
VLRAPALVDRCERPQGGPPEHPEAVLVDRLNGAVAVGWKLAASRDPNRVVALLEQHSLGADPDRERQPRELAQRAAAARRAIELLAYRVSHRSLQADAGAARVVRPCL